MPQIGSASSATGTAVALTGDQSIAGHKTFAQEMRVSTSESAKFRAGSGAAVGPPPSAPTVSTSGAGGLTGTYQYAYTESFNGETTLSPAASVVAASNKILVVTPYPRRGSNSRKLYRTIAGGSSFFLVHDFGDNYYQTEFLDNVADGSLGAAAPTSDSSAFFDLYVSDTVKFLCSHPNDVGAADLTLLTQDPSVLSQSWSIDSYGTITARSRRQAAINIIKTGTETTALVVSWKGIRDDGVGAVTVFDILPQGQVEILPNADGVAALRVQPSVAITTGPPAIVQFIAAASTTVHVLQITNNGTGDSIRDSAGNFRVKQDGTLNLVTTSTWSHIPYLQILNQFKAPYVTSTPTLDTNGELRVDNAGQIWFYSNSTRYKLVGTAA